MTIWLKTIAWRHPDMPWKYETECDSESPGEWYYNRRKWELSQVTNGKDYDEMALIFAIELPNEVPYPAERDNSTLPPGLQAIREHGVGWCNEKQFADVLDLTETLAGALNWLTHLVNDVGKAGGRPEPGEFEAAEAAARAALTKYREFGQPKVERET